MIFGGQGANLKERDVARRDSQSCLSAATLYLDRLQNVTTLYSIVLDGIESVIQNETTSYACLVPHSRLQF